MSSPKPEPAPEATSVPAINNKRPFQQKDNNGRNWKPKKTKREKNIEKGSSEDILRLDIEALLRSRPEPEGGDSSELPELGSEIEVDVLALSSTGDGLAMRPGSRQVYVVPFVVPGDKARVKVYRHTDSHSMCDFISVVEPAPDRDDSLINCKYFAKCGGCQFQMLPYEKQLANKKTILEKAYRNFSDLPPELVPVVGDTIGSPLQYGYRTKLTPHFDGPPGQFSRRRKGNSKATFESRPDIGFMIKGQRKTLDIEECPIGTPAVNMGMKSERERMKTDYSTYKKGATLLLREHTQRIPKESPVVPGTIPPNTYLEPAKDDDKTVDLKTCVTDHKAQTTEYIDGYSFTNPAGSFFQNNNSILPKFTAYIRDHILPSRDPGSIKYLIDAYSGSGLFTVTLSKVFQHSTGIDVASDSIACARGNAARNGVSEDRCTFIAADAGELFKSVTYNADETVVVLDPPRKGCDADFLSQLRHFGPRRVVYVSCNVHTQARDVGELVRGQGSGRRYEMESLVGFDFFPQTGHVEGVAILNRVEE